MLTYLIAFLAGVLTVLAPCVLPLLPILIGSSATSGDLKNKFPWGLFGIVAGLAVSVFVFTLLLRTSIRFNPLLGGLSDNFWAAVSGGIIGIFGLFSLFPGLWDRIATKLKLNNRSDILLHKAGENKSRYSPVLLGAALGPVFSSCSPTFFVILGLLTLEGGFWQGILLLLFYVAGLSLIMLAIGVFGRALVKKLGWASDPNGWLKKGLGIVLILAGLAIALRLDKSFEAVLLETGIYDGLQGFENNLTSNGQIFK
jgi:cytochrome c-type biogenesis protein